MNILRKIKHVSCARTTGCFDLEELGNIFQGNDEMVILGLLQGTFSAASALRQLTLPAFLSSNCSQIL